MRDDRHAASYASGLLIGTDVASQPSLADGTVHLIADALLGELYAKTIEQLGGHAITIPSRDAFVAGMTTLKDLLP